MNYGQQDGVDEDPLTGVDSPAKEDKEHPGEVPPGTQKATHHSSSPGATSFRSRLGALANKRVISVAIILGFVTAAVLIAYLLLGRSGSPAPQPKAGPSTVSPSPATPGKGANAEVFGLFDEQTPDQKENESWPVVAARITLKLALGALLATLLAFRPRRDSPMTIRNPYVAQTQILLAVVAAALMMVVADNAARAFGIFAAASLVRFRTNIRDPKEITVLLISLAIGLATGVGKVEVAIILSLFSLVVVSLLEYYEPEQIFRAMELTVASRKVSETDEMLREIFEKRNMQGELRKVDREDPDNPIGKIVYFLNVGADLSTDKLSEEIFASDPENIDSIQWDQKKTSSYVYR